MKIIERIPAHYQTQEVEDLGRVYSWCPEQVVLECGARCSASVREELVVEKLAEEEYIHPWRYWHSKENAGIPI